ncbi:serine/threonine-protein kinase 19 [Onychostruthus taczanowskii]|uniref:serine/threonine-protein kinase 19 n=1 Tax=Onychostruthus taczanowskii TaxID=356909 RepID=UPI001B8026D8|nr:serine/threonine-protein kinase 19 [Onychostruthus taczanowskii]
MSRRRRFGDTDGALAAKRRRPELPGEPPRPDGSPAAVEAALGAVAALFPRRLFGDALPPLVLRHQLYDVVRDRTAVDRHLNRLRTGGRVRLLHLGLGPDVLGVVSLELYREKWERGASGTATSRRRAVLSLVRRSRLRQVPLRELQRLRAPPGAALGVPFLLHDLLGEGRLQRVPTASGPLLRLAEP